MAIEFNNKNYHVNWYPKENNSFRYTVIDNLFKESFRSELVSYFNKNLRDKLRRFPHYDCDVLCIDPKNKHPFNFVYSLEWKNFISNIFPDIPITNNIMAEIQHNHIGSKDGWIHNDYDASHFVNDPVNNGINPWYYQCPYRQEEPNENLITNVRSIAVIYYLNDQENWKEGDGGETALFDEGRNIPLSDYIMKTNPVPNRLFVYEINPFSFHSFLSNKKFERTTIMMWYHTSAEDTNKRYGWYGEDFYKGVTDSDLQLMKKQWKGNDIKDLDTFSSMHYYCKHADRHIDLHQNVEHPYDHYCPENTNGKKRIK